MTFSNRSRTREILGKLQLNSGRIAMFLAVFAGCRDSTTQPTAWQPDQLPAAGGIRDGVTGKRIASQRKTSFRFNPRSLKPKSRINKTV